MRLREEKYWKNNLKRLPQMHKDKQTRLIDFINDNLNILKKILKKYETEDNAGEKEILLAALERKAEESVESAIKLNQDLLEEKGEVAKSYYSSFIDLKKLDIFSENFLDKIASTAGFRNRLAHEYMDLDEKITIKTIKKILKIYPKYLLRIIKYVNKDQK
ncbi:DUF86 domain-containing protein [Candidatus Woesearchaeota archaeon]|nr:DUF86 domain-containing protein [Candidatus Woesearchaeota archaeon]